MRRASEAAPGAVCPSCERGFPPQWSGAKVEEARHLETAFIDVYEALQDMVNQHGGVETCLSANEDAADVLSEYYQLFKKSRGG